MMNKIQVVCDLMLSQQPAVYFRLNSCSLGLHCLVTSTFLYIGYEVLHKNRGL